MCFDLNLTGNAAFRPDYETGDESIRESRLGTKNLVSSLGKNRIPCYKLTVVHLGLMGRRKYNCHKATCEIELRREKFLFESAVTH